MLMPIYIYMQINENGYILGYFPFFSMKVNFVSIWSVNSLEFEYDVLKYNYL